MIGAAPTRLLTLLETSTPEARSAAWSAFLEEWSPLLLHVAGAVRVDHDGIMDRYAFMVEELQRDDLRRLRRYRTDGRGAFSTWLLVIARRLCADYYRHRYGRPQSDSDRASARQAERRQLTDLIGDEVGLTLLEAPDHTIPDEAVQRLELKVRLESALQELDPSDRLLLRLRFEEDLSVPEIARALGIDSPFVAYRRIDRILGRLRSSLKSRGVEDSVP